MGDTKKQRVDNALSSLIDNLIPRSADKDNGTTDETRDDALEWAKDIIEGHAKNRYTRTEPC